MWCSLLLHSQLGQALGLVSYDPPYLDALETKAQVHLLW